MIPASSTLSANHGCRSRSHKIDADSHGLRSDMRGYAAFLPDSTLIAPDPARFRGEGAAEAAKDWI